MTVHRVVLGSVALLAACNTAPVLPPADDRTIEVVETELWSGGEIRAVVRHAEGEEAPIAITLDGGALTVTRVDDTTFTATLPVHTGVLAVRVERQGLAALDAMLKLHGFESVVSGPLVAGAVVARPGPVTHVLGAVVGGAVEVSLETGVIGRSWGREVHALECSNGIAPGPQTGTVLLRPRAANGDCLSRTIQPYTAQGLGPVTEGMTWPSATNGLSAIVGPATFISPFHDAFAFVTQCELESAWTLCNNGELYDPPIHHHVLGWVAGYVAQRIVSVSWRAGLHDLQTGAVVGVLPAGPSGIALLHAAAFSATEDTLFIAGRPNCCDNSGFVQLHDAATGSMLTSIPISDGAPIAIAIDQQGGRILVVIHDDEGDAVWLRVFSRSHEMVIDLPISEGSFPENVWRHRHHSLLFDPLQREAILLSSAYHFPGFGGSVVRPMQIHRWTLAPE
jgi:hypothetical protein